jgi:hypothetical protein
VCDGEVVCDREVVCAREVVREISPCEMLQGDVEERQPDVEGRSQGYAT